MNQLKEKGKMIATWEVGRWASDKDKGMGVVYSDAESVKLFGTKQHTSFVRNVLLNEGINEIWSLICGTGGVQFDNTNAYLGVGNSSTAEGATDTGLLGASKLYKAMEATFPTYGTSQQAVWKSSFGSAEANYAWEEFTVANGNSDSADNLNRKTSSEGTKTVGQTWELTLTITLS